MFAWKKAGYVGFQLLFGVFRHLAPISFGIYLLHYPWICMWGAVPAGGAVYFDLGLRVCIVFVLAWVLEVPFQRWIYRITDGWLERSSCRAKISPTGLHSDGAPL